MAISVRVHARSRRVLLDVPHQNRHHRRGIEQALYEIGDINVAEVRRLIRTGTRTGRVYIFRGRRHKASAPGEIPANRSGRLARSSEYRVHGWYQMTFGETAPYAIYLEGGTRRMAPRPHMVVTVNNTAGQALAALHRYPAEAIGASGRGRAR